ncbi:MerR family transcriptional regulator [Vallitalea okinawensis]|uniref:MerR family transcriptional regulator n=1 Tax=Vallitalea okinawensis TaxID=2078660 RepID=UPI00130074BD|nr:MerR family transcriptional regulator [Vallitalea okinawensis]
MKIGQLSKTYTISVDNIRYYINLGLLVPEKKNTQYIFNDKDEEDLQVILHLKKLRFTLKEIHQILSIRRVSNLVDPKDIHDLIHLYEDKKEQILTEKSVLERIINDIDEDIHSLSMIHTSKEANKTGVPLQSLSYLCCPTCMVPLKFKNVEMNHQYIFEGDLFCDCGYSATIQDGIVLTQNKNTSLYDQPDLEREFYLDIPPSLVSLFQKSYNWMMDKFDMTTMKNKVILETHINAYFFMHKHIMDMDKDALYIVIDKFPEMISMYKKRIEYLNLDLNILYIADNSVQYPIKEHSIDLFIDYFSTNEHCFYNNTYLVPSIRRYFHNHTEVIGTYFYFDPFSKSITNLCDKYPEAYVNNFNKEYFKGSTEDAGFHIQDYNEIGFITKSGDNRAFSFHEDGERMHMFSYHSVKK